MKTVRHEIIDKKELVHINIFVTASWEETIKSINATIGLSPRPTTRFAKGLNRLLICTASSTRHLGHWHKHVHCHLSPHRKYGSQINIEKMLRKERGNSQKLIYTPPTLENTVHCCHSSSSAKKRKCKEHSSRWVKRDPLYTCQVLHTYELQYCSFTGDY